MTEQEAIKAAAELEAADTDIAALDQKILEAIASARVHNRTRKVFEDERDAIRSRVQPLREAVAKHVQEVKRQQAEKARAEAEAKAKEPQPPSQLELLTAQVAELTKALAAKG